MKKAIDSQKALLVIFTLLCLFIGTAILVFGWTRTWTALHVPTLSPIFADMRTVQGSILSDKLGLDPQISNPGDPWKRSLDYPKIWLWIAKLFQLNNETNFIVFVCVFVLAYIVSCFLLLRNSPSPYLLLVIFSWPSLLAVERGNNDLLVFVLLFAGIALSQGYFRAISILLATVLKVFPVFSVVALAKKPKLFILLVLLSAVYFIGIAGELKVLQAGNTALTDSAAIFATYGFETDMLVIRQFIGGQPAVVYTLLKYGLIVVSLGLSVAISRIKSLKLASSSPFKTDLFIAGGSILAGTYLVTSNWDYRLIFLLLCIPYILSIQSRVVRHSMLIGILLASNAPLIGDFYSQPGIMIGVLSRYYVFLMVTACLVREFSVYVPAAFLASGKAYIPNWLTRSPIQRLKQFFVATFNHGDGRNKPWYLKPGSWGRIIILLAVLVYFGNIAQRFYIRHFVPHFGTLNLHVTGLRPPGNLIINLKTDYTQNFSRSSHISFDSTEMTIPVDGLYFGDYVIQVIHDENNNKTADLDSLTGLFREGFGMVNIDRLDLRNAAAVKVRNTYDNLKYAFHKDGETVEIKMYYAPFPWQTK